MVVMMLMMMLMIEIRIRAETGQLIGDQRLDLLVNTNCNALQNWYCTIYCTTCTELALYHVNIKTTVSHVKEKLSFVDELNLPIIFAISYCIFPG